MRPFAIIGLAFLLASAVLLAGPAWDVGPAWIRSAIFLLVLAGAALLSIRLMLFKPEAVTVAAGLSAVFLTGFTAALVQADRDWEGWDIEVGAIGLVLTFATIVLTGWFANARWTAALACAVFIPLSWIAAILGSYAAYATGWRGLDISTFGSDDQPGLANAAVTFALATPFWSTFAVVAGAIGWFVNSVRPRDDQPPADTSLVVTGAPPAPSLSPRSDEPGTKRFRFRKRPAGPRLAG